MRIADPLYLEEGIARFVTCNATVDDVGGAFDLAKVNATLYKKNASHDGAANDNNAHYTNTSCINISTVGNSKTFVCGFGIWYYANSGNWSCNVTVMDQSNTTAVAHINTSVASLYAISTSSMLTFTALEPGATSSQDSNLSIVNYGNQPINVSLRGYGSFEGDGNAMICTTINITLLQQRYNVFPGLAFDNLKVTPSSASTIQNFTLPQRTDDTSFKNDRNTTYWKLRAPSGARGSCNGTLVFSLEVG